MSFIPWWYVSVLPTACCAVPKWPKNVFHFRQCFNRLLTILVKIWCIWGIRDTSQSGQTIVIVSKCIKKTEFVDMFFSGLPWSGLSRWLPNQTPFKFLQLLLSLTVLSVSSLLFLPVKNRFRIRSLFYWSFLTHYCNCILTPIILLFMELSWEESCEELEIDTVTVLFFFARSVFLPLLLQKVQQLLYLGKLNNVIESPDFP